MRANELWVRCQKARIVSWLNSDKVGATLPLNDGQYVLLAIYENGRYVKPETVTIPASLPADWVGPDGPFQIPEDTTEEDTDGTTDGG
jgi:hypothetical protein